VPLIIPSLPFEGNRSDKYWLWIFLDVSLIPLRVAWGLSILPVFPTTRLGTLAHTIQLVESNARIKFVKCEM